MPPVENEAVIKVEGLGKRYRLGQTVDLKRTLQDAMVGLPRLFGRVAGGLRRSRESLDPETPPGTFWALRDIHFQVNRGEIIGVIGGNGAGKSTLLKILSRITEPTKGRAEIRGRVASLLEVGTGFHPELTGRENVFLNGSILGMHRFEIRRKFDEIVAFAEVEKFIDTPVKRYSSGMRVRLGFAVAAHLEPEILLVDEVLAVGDMEFQKKCIGKMHDVSNQGRTILFVSHNMHSIRHLCGRGILLRQGRVALDTGVDEVVDRYVADAHNDALNTDIPAEMHKNPEPDLEVRHIEILDRQGQSTAVVMMDEPFSVQIRFTIRNPGVGYAVALRFLSRDGSLLATLLSSDQAPFIRGEKQGRYVLRAEVENVFQPGTYVLDLSVESSLRAEVDRIEGFQFVVANSSHVSAAPPREGLLRLGASWNLEKQVDEIP